MLVVRELHDGWTVSPVGGLAADRVDLASTAASVPGCVHTDLLAAGLIPDPYLDRHELELAWIGRTDWQYDTNFEWTPSGVARVELVCDGLDTIATVTVNGTEVAKTYNMHRGYRFDVAQLLIAGSNQLSIRFASAYAYAYAEQARLGDRPSAYVGEPFNFIRKMACNFGWDWGPSLVTAGIWQPISLQWWSRARLGTVRPDVTVEGSTGHVAVHVDLARTDDNPVVVTATINGSTVEAVTERSQVTLELDLADVELWWPRGYGEQPRYDLRVDLRDGSGAPLDAWATKIGFRTVRLDTAADQIGSAYTLCINGQPVWIRGVNWIPDDCFANRTTRDRLAQRFTQSAEANVNYLRVWGGGRYESEDFYDLADEMGFLVGQDFLFACAAYPEEEPHRNEVIAEAEQNVIRLSPHPSLVTWTGNNENIWGHADWGWIEQLKGRTWGAGYYYDVLADIVARLDPSRPYWPGSPYSGDPTVYPNDPNHGSMHIWDVWNDVDYTHYRDYVPRMAAEFGYQGPATYATIKAAIADDPLTHDSAGMAHHQKAIDGDLKLQRGLDAHMPVPSDFDDWHYLTQLDQARAVQLGIEHFRSHQPVCMGSIVWQLNDCWPVTSWAAIDGYGRRKPLWYALRAAFADRLLTFQPREGALALIAVNDSDDAWSAQAVINRYSFAGSVLASVTVEVQVAPRSAVTLPLPADVAVTNDAGNELLRARADGLRADWFFAEDKDIAFPTADWSASVDGNRVTVTATTILRDLTLFADRVSPDAWADQAMVTLLAGESVTFTVHGELPADVSSRLITRPVLRAVNDLS
jgi:beta-mannosidase